MKRLAIAAIVAFAAATVGVPNASAAIGIPPTIGIPPNPCAVTIGIPRPCHVTLHRRVGIR